MDVHHLIALPREGYRGDLRAVFQHQSEVLYFALRSRIELQSGRWSPRRSLVRVLIAALVRMLIIVWIGVLITILLAGWCGIRRIVAVVVGVDVRVATQKNRSNHAVAEAWLARVPVHCC